MSPESFGKINRVEVADNNVDEKNSFEYVSGLDRFHAPDEQAKLLVEQILQGKGFESLDYNEKISALDELLNHFTNEYMSAVNATTEELKKKKFNSYYLLEATAKIKNATELRRVAETEELNNYFRQMGVSA